jgi:hypothetical protein
MSWRTKSGGGKHKFESTLMSEENKNVVIIPAPVTLKLKVINPTAWVPENFAQDWFADTLHEAKKGTDHYAIRREVVFATCFLESYLFEWTREKIQIEEINCYFPPGDYTSLKCKWKSIPQKLAGKNKLISTPTLDLSGLGELIKYRNGLVHAKASAQQQIISHRMRQNRFPRRSFLIKRDRIGR